MAERTPGPLEKKAIDDGLIPAEKDMTPAEKLESDMMYSLLSTGRWDDDVLGISIVLGFD